MSKRFVSLSVKRLLAIILTAFLVKGVPTVFSKSTGTPTDGTFNIFIVTPAEGALSDINLAIGATITSTLQLNSVKADVDGRQVILAFSNSAVCNGGSCSPGWAGELSLAGLTRGAKTLTVAATDVFGGSGQAQRHFIFDRRPNVTVTNPIAESVTGLTVHVKADCADDDPAGCKSMSVFYQHPSSAPGTSGTLLTVNQSTLDQDVTIPAMIKDFATDGNMLFLGVRATDSGGQTQTQTRIIYIQQHSRLTEIESFKGRILDAQSDRVLLLENPGSADNILKIHRRSTGEEVVIPLAGRVVQTSPYGTVAEGGFLSPKGALFAATDVTTPDPGRVYEWRDGTLVALEALFTDAIAGDGLRVRGDYALYDSYDHAVSSSILLLRNLISGTTTEIAKINGGGSADLAANGDVVYSFQDDIYRYHNGASTKLTNDAQDFVNNYPVTDGINVVYQKQPKQTDDRKIVLIEASAAQSDLSTWPHALNPSEYRAAGGWIAFPKASGGVVQIWTRSPAGNTEQISFYGTSSTVNRLSSIGDLTYVGVNGAQGFGNPSRLNLHQSGQPSIDVAAAGPVTFLLGDQWYAFLGRTLFRLPTVSEVSPVLLTDATTGRALALTPVTHVREPFPFASDTNFSADHQTRMLLFARNIDWLNVNTNPTLTVQAEDATHRTFALPIEYAAPNTSMNWLTEIIVRLPDDLSNGGVFSITLNAGGFVSNKATVVILRP